MIKIQNLNKYYGDVQILKNVDMEISKGEIFGIIGHSGAGKSTLLRCINGLEDYRDGGLTVEGQEVKDLTEKGSVFFNSFNAKANSRTSSSLFSCATKRKSYPSKENSLTSFSRR